MKDLTALSPRQRWSIIVISILLHILFLLLWDAVEKLDLFDKDDPVKALAESQPIVFDLREMEPDVPREVIETPKDAKTVEKQDRANFLSDKNALARNQDQAPKDLDIGEGFARGDFNSHELPENQGPVGITPKPLQPDNTREEQKPTEETKEKSDLQPEDVSVEKIVRDWEERKRRQAQDQQLLPPGVREQLPHVLHDNPESRSLDSGGLSFNTYNWEYAPYMLMLKRRIGRNIFPPMAFTHLGIISGETLLRFKIYPDGRLENLVIIGYNGHKALMETSFNAVNVSAPFPVLPTDFPKPFLEVTGKFVYFVRR